MPTHSQCATLHAVVVVFDVLHRLPQCPGALARQETRHGLDKLSGGSASRAEVSGLGWVDDDVAEVARYLNALHYYYPTPD